MGELVNAYGSLFVTAHKKNKSVLIGYVLGLYGLLRSFQSPQSINSAIILK